MPDYIDNDAQITQIDLLLHNQRWWIPDDNTKMYTNDDKGLFEWKCQG